MVTGALRASSCTIMSPRLVASSTYGASPEQSTTTPVSLVLPPVAPAVLPSPPVVACVVSDPEVGAPLGSLAALVPASSLSLALALPPGPALQASVRRSRSTGERGHAVVGTHALSLASRSHAIGRPKIAPDTSQQRSTATRGILVHTASRRDFSGLGTATAVVGSPA